MSNALIINSLQWTVNSIEGAGENRKGILSGGGVMYNDRKITRGEKRKWIKAYGCFVLDSKWDVDDN